VKTLRIVAFSDCRAQDLEAIVSWVEGRLKKPDLIIYAGDDIARFIPDPKTNYFEQLASLSRYGVVAVAGNDDLPEHRDLIRGRKVYEIHSQPVAIGRFLFVGVEGAPVRKDDVNLGFTLYSESEIAQHLYRSLPESENCTIVLVSHAPPRGCLDEAMRWGIRQIGSTAIRDIVEKDPRVALVVSGHVHLCGGRRDRLGPTVVLNAASNDKVGSPAKIATLLLRPGGAVENFRWTELSSSFQIAESVA
jgi:Icc-related predicted phosphoesterase